MKCASITLNLVKVVVMLCNCFASTVNSYMAMLTRSVNLNTLFLGKL